MHRHGSAYRLIVNPHPLLASLIIVAALFLGACPISVTCEDTGCPTSQVCNVSTGACEDRELDCRVANICRADEVCDSETGTCRPEALRCTQSFTCPDGQICNASSGFCEPALRCESNEDCGIAEDCNLATQECQTRTCLTDADCPVAHVCDDDLECTPGCRPGADGCASRQFCAVLTGESVGTCLPDCRLDADCPFGQFCDRSSTDSTCVIEGPCTQDADCRADEACVQTRCVQPLCAADDECLEGQVCEVSTQTCRNAACEEDEFGSGSVANHSMQTAVSIDFGSYTQLTLCPGRSDWFAIDLRSPDVVRVRVATRPETGDFDVYAYDQSGVMIAAAQQVSPVSALKFGAEREQVVFLEIRPTTFEGGQYDLSLTPEICADDQFEENDTAANATVIPSSIGVPSELPLKVCGSDDDWLRVRQNDPDAGLAIERVGSLADLQVDVFTPDGSTIALSPGDEYRALRVGVTGSTQIHAYSGLGQNGDYRLRIETLAPWICPGAGSQSAPSAGEPIASDTTMTYSFCPFDGSWEVDWIEIEVAEAGVADIVVIPATAEPDLDVALLTGDEAAPTFVRAATTSGDRLALQASVDPSQRWFVRVSSSSNLGRIVDPPGYELSYVLR